MIKRPIMFLLVTVAASACVSSDGGQKEYYYDDSAKTVSEDDILYAERIRAAALEGKGIAELDGCPSREKELVRGIRASNLPAIYILGYVGDTSACYDERERNDRAKEVAKRQEGAARREKLESECFKWAKERDSKVVPYDLLKYCS